MSKAVLVLDEMPERCENCPVFYRTSGDFGCNASSCHMFDWRGRPDWCPLQPPELEWISVEDSLPENTGFNMSDEVLCWYEYFRYGDFNCMEQTFGIGRYDYTYNSWCGEVAHGTDCRVLFWARISPPGGEGERNER